ncbi:hypothetical protein GJAV_G00210050 [Gymnothorax javanicus]|nr:hypothetical protein GJAV_G00210050 [Gymnothorax javanicus]
MAARSFLCNPSNFVHLILVLPSLSMTDPIDEEVAVTLGSSVRLICSHKSRRSPINVTWRVEFDTGTRVTVEGNEHTTKQNTPYVHLPASSTAPQSQLTQMFCIKDAKSGT